MAWSRTCRPTPPVAANIVSFISCPAVDRLRETVSSHRAVVVEPEKGDHLTNVRLVPDGPGGRSLRIGEYRVRNDSTLLSQLRPELLRKAEVCRPVAVQVADLPAAEFERQLTTLPRHRTDARPGRDLTRDLIPC